MVQYVCPNIVSYYFEYLFIVNNVDIKQFEGTLYTKMIQIIFKKI